ncbi:hypothetical protein ALC60_07318, partial [Trachymyrmex zeteki]
NKIHEILSDNNTYININKDPTNMMTNQTHTLLTRWKKKRYIDQSTYNKLNVSNSIESIEKRWIYISKNTSIPKKEFLNAISLIINPTYFSNLIKNFLNKSDDDSVNFLDVNVILNDDCIKFDMYKKPMNFSGIYLSYISNHPIQHKRGVIIGQLDRILFLSHPEYHKKNIESMINILLINGYPLDTIFSTINNKIKKLSSRKNLYKNKIGNNNESIDFNRKKYFQCDVVYKISNLDCNSSYVSQTKRKAKTRIKEHKANIKNSKDSLTVLSQHQIDCGHNDDIQLGIRYRTVLSKKNYVRNDFY